MKLQYIPQFQQQCFNLKCAYNNVFTPLYRSKMNSHLSTTCVGATCARMGWNSRHILTPSHITNTFPLKRKINKNSEPCYTKLTWLRTRKSSKSSTESLLKSHPGITSNEQTKEPTEWVLHLILSSVSAWGIRFTIRYQHDCFATGYLKSLFRHV